MRQLVIGVFSAGILLTATVVANAGQPFYGDATGFIPPTVPTRKCEATIGKAAGKAAACIGKCTAARADGKLADDTAEDACEKNNAGKSCLELFAAAATKAQEKDSGPSGCGCVNISNLSTIIEADLDSMNSAVYCDTTSGTPFGGDDTGDIPVAGSPVAMCEDTVNKLVGKAIACVIKCHAAQASRKLDQYTEDTCEKFNAGKACFDKFQAGVAKLTGCPPCINATTLFGTIETTLDAGNGLTYCASPSGAFVE